MRSHPIVSVGTGGPGRGWNRWRLANRCLPALGPETPSESGAAFTFVYPMDAIWKRSIGASSPVVLLCNIKSRTASRPSRFFSPWTAHGDAYSIAPSLDKELRPPVGLSSYHASQASPEVSVASPPRSWPANPLPNSTAVVTRVHA